MSSPFMVRNLRADIPGRPIAIDGSRGEGGGQILRTALALSMITGAPFEIVNIRANRKSPGLKAQHLECIQAARRICGARVDGAVMGSRRVVFEPGPVRHGRYDFRIETAGSVALLLHCVYLPLCLAEGPSELRITGGTHVMWAPTFDYLDLCWVPFMRDLGLQIEVELVRAGFYPHGGGEIVARIRAGGVKNLAGRDRGRLHTVRVRSAQTNLREEVARRQAAGAEQALRNRGIQAEVEIGALESRSRSTAIAVSGSFEHSRCCFTGLGEPGKRAEVIGREVAGEFLRFLDSGAFLDEHMADQILLPASVAAGDSEFTCPGVTEHFLSNGGVISLFKRKSYELLQGGSGPAGVKISDDGP
jgi:RNA 3'-terminal phosphate cyclase (ATP)